MFSVLESAVGLDSFWPAEVFFHGLKMELSFWNGLFVGGLW